MIQTILTRKQSDLLENLIVKYGQTVTSQQIFDEAAGSWDYRQTKNLITKLVKNGWLVRLKRGLYAISDLSTRGFLSLSPFIVANLLVADSYVSFESALSEYGMVDQLTSRIISVSLRSFKLTVVSGIEYSFVKTKPRYYFGWQDIAIGNSVSRIAIPEKALIDMVNFHKSQYSIDLVIEKILDYQNDLDFDCLNTFLESFPVTTIKIFGFIFDLAGINSDRLQNLINARSTSWMLPEARKFCAKWRLYYPDYFEKFKKS